MTKPREAVVARRKGRTRNVQAAPARVLTRRALFVYEDQWDALLELARQTGAPISHYVRQGLDVVLANHHASAAGRCAPTASRQRAARA